MKPPKYDKSILATTAVATGADVGRSELLDWQKRAATHNIMRKLHQVGKPAPTNETEADRLLLHLSDVVTRKGKPFFPTD